MDVVDSKTRQHLLRALESTVARLRELGGPQATAERADPTGVNTVMDEADEAHLGEAEEQAMATRARLTRQLRQIQSAVERLDRGEYGRCSECGRAIGRARLRALPEADTCVACQERRERRAAA